MTIPSDTLRQNHTDENAATDMGSYSALAGGWSERVFIDP